MNHLFSWQRLANATCDANFVAAADCGLVLHKDKRPFRLWRPLKVKVLPFTLDSPSMHYPVMSCPCWVRCGCTSSPGESDGNSRYRVSFWRKEFARIKLVLLNLFLCDLPGCSFVCGFPDNLDTLGHTWPSRHNQFPWINLDFHQKCKHVTITTPPRYTRCVVLLCFGPVLSISFRQLAIC